MAKVAIKAIAAGVFSLVGVLGASMTDGDLTRKESLIALGGALIAAAGTYVAPRNEDAE